LYLAAIESSVSLDSTLYTIPETGGILIVSHGLRTLFAPKSLDQSIEFTETLNFEAIALKLSQF
jgi:hypothetical protein